MLYSLTRPFADQFILFNLFRYITFRSGAACLTALLVSFVVGPVFIRQVVKRADGKLVNAVIETYDDVSQFWTFDPKAYLANPPFSQEFQQQ